MAEHPIRRGLTKLGVWTAHPTAFLIVPIYGAAWFSLDRQSFGWAGIAVLATWFMTLVIQRAEHRDTQALHAKLDELLHAQPAASNKLTMIDRQDPEEIEKHRREARLKD
jgi:low affinity Fe/Cu permease